MHLDAVRPGSSGGLEGALDRPEVETGRKVLEGDGEFAQLGGADIRGRGIGGVGPAGEKDPRQGEGDREGRDQVPKSIPHPTSLPAVLP